MTDKKLEESLEPTDHEIQHIPKEEVEQVNTQVPEEKPSRNWIKYAACISIFAVAVYYFTRKRNTQI